MIRQAADIQCHPSGNLPFQVSLTLGQPGQNRQKTISGLRLNKISRDSIRESVLIKVPSKSTASGTDGPAPLVLFRSDAVTS